MFSWPLPQSVPETERETRRSPDTDARPEVMLARSRRLTAQFFAGAPTVSAPKRLVCRLGLHRAGFPSYGDGQAAQTYAEHVCPRPFVHQQCGGPGSGFFNHPIVIIGKR